MIVIVPKTMTDAIFISSSAPENEYPEYNPATTYTEGAKVQVTAVEHMIYEALPQSSGSAANVGKTPIDNPTWWNPVGSTNRFKMFDNKNSSQTVVTGDLTISVRPGIINSVGLSEVDGSAISVVMRDGTNTIVYEKSANLQLYNVDNFYDYFFKEFEFSRTLLLDDLPPIYEGVVTITISAGNDGQARCGVCVFGKSEDIGPLAEGVKISEVDYSTIKIDTFGDKFFFKRLYDGTLKGQLLIEDKNRRDAVIRILHSVRATPTFWYGDVGLDEATMYGWRTNFDSTHNYGHSLIDLQLQSLT